MGRKPRPASGGGGGLTGCAVPPRVGPEAGVLPKPAWVQEGPTAGSGSRVLSGGCGQGLGMGGSHPVWWAPPGASCPRGRAGVD